MDNILLAKKYKVRKWLLDGYVQLLQQKEALEFGDDICNSEIDLITIARLLYIREKKHCQLQCAVHCRHCKRKADEYFFSIDKANREIEEVFADEISGMQDD